MMAYALELLVPCLIFPEHTWSRIREVDTNENRSRALERCQCGAERHGVRAYRVLEEPDAGGNVVEAWGPVDGRWHWIVEDEATAAHGPQSKCGAHTDGRHIWTAKLEALSGLYPVSRGSAVKVGDATLPVRQGDPSGLGRVHRARCDCGEVMLSQRIEFTDAIEQWENRVFTVPMLEALSLRTSPFWRHVRELPPIGPIIETGQSLGAPKLSDGYESLPHHARKRADER